MKRIGDKTAPSTPVSKRKVPKEVLPVAGEEQVRRVRRLCAALPQTTERLSHGEPTFFVGGKVYVMNKTQPTKFFMPPYVGARGWIGIELDAINELESGRGATPSNRIAIWVP